MRWPVRAAALVLAACSSAHGGQHEADAQPPPTEEHDVVLADCASTPLRSEWLVVPTALDDCPQGGSTNCGTACARASDCTERPFGRCVAQPLARCAYAGGATTRAACTQAADCNLTDGGTCRAEARSPRSFCHYQAWAFNGLDTCENDEDCTLASQGRCLHHITRSRCDYQQCLTHDDCGLDAACVCDRAYRRCVPAHCRGDGDCSPGQRCRPSQQVLGATDGLYCTRAEDPCARDEDCAPQQRVCAFDVDAGSWGCVQQHTVGP